MDARRVRRNAAVAAAVMLAAVVVTGASFARAASFVARVSGVGGWSASAAEWFTEPIFSRDLLVPTRTGDARARLYLPSSIRRAAVLVPGIHPDGIDERRLVGLARELARTRMAILTPTVSDFTRFRITADAVDQIEDVTAWLAAQREYAPAGNVGIMGISFSGGLSIVAAGRPRIRSRMAFVFSLGGHGNLERVLRFLCTGVAADGTRHQPHDYGLAVVTLSLAPKLVPAEQIQRFSEGVETFLVASALDHVHDPRARERFERARIIADELPAPAGRLLHLVNTRDVTALGPILLPHVTALAAEPSLSPERVPSPSAPVYLLHGSDDTVVPSAESALLARFLQERGVATHVLLTPLIVHAEVERPPGPIDLWRLIAFWKGLLEE